MAKKQLLTKMRVDSVDAVDRGAGEGCVVKLIKRDAGQRIDKAAGFATREQALQAAANDYTATIAKSATAPSSEYAEYRKRLFESAPWHPLDTAPAPVNEAYEKLMKRAGKLADADPSRTVEQHFEKLFSDPGNASLAAAAKLGPRPASASKYPPKGRTGLNPKDTNDDLDDAQADDDAEPDEDDDDTLGGPFGPSSPASRQSAGRSPSTYLNSGSNLNQVPKPAVTGAVSTDRDRTGRPNSAKKAFTLKKKAAKRAKRYIAKNPGAGRSEAMSYATASKEQRQAFKEWRRAS